MLRYPSAWLRLGLLLVMTIFLALLMPGFDKPADSAVPMRTLSYELDQAAIRPVQASTVTTKPVKMTVKVAVPLRNVRTVATTQDNQPVKRLTNGAVVTVHQSVSGQDPYNTGYQTWYQLTDGTYMWAKGLQTVQPVVKAKPSHKPAAKPKHTKPKRAKVGKARYVKPLNGRFTSDFGWRSRPCSSCSNNHMGIDLAAPAGTAIHAVTAGKVIAVGWMGSCGRGVIIRVSAVYTNIYCHASRTYVRAGQKVATGQRIAAVGRTGAATGYHLHFGVKKNGSFIDPEPWLKARGVYVR